MLDLKPGNGAFLFWNFFLILLLLPCNYTHSSMYGLLFHGQVQKTLNALTAAWARKKYPFWGWISKKIQKHFFFFKLKKKLYSIFGNIFRWKSNPTMSFYSRVISNFKSEVGHYNLDILSLWPLIVSCGRRKEEKQNCN